MIGINIPRIILDSYKIPLIHQKTTWHGLGRVVRWLVAQVNTLGKTLKRLIIYQKKVNTCFYETMWS